MCSLVLNLATQKFELFTLKTLKIQTCLLLTGTLSLTHTNSKTPKRCKLKIYLHQETGVYEYMGFGTGCQKVICFSRSKLSDLQHGATSSNHPKKHRHRASLRHVNCGTGLYLRRIIFIFIHSNKGAKSSIIIFQSSTMSPPPPPPTIRPTATCDLPNQRVMRDPSRATCNFQIK